MDSRAARRAGEKAARDLVNARAGLIGELGVARTECTQAEAGVVAARDRGRQLITAAEANAGRLLEAAQAAVCEAEQHYTDVYNAAAVAGWTAADLDSLGFRPGTTRTRRGRTGPRRSADVS